MSADILDFAAPLSNEFTATFLAKTMLPIHVGFVSRYIGGAVGYDRCGSIVVGGRDLAMLLWRGNCVQAGCNTSGNDIVKERSRANAFVAA